MDNQPLQQRALPSNTKWYHALPLLGLSKHDRLEIDYRNELAARHIDASLWEAFDVDDDVKNFVCKKLATEIWSSNKIKAEINFHPQDPYFVVDGLQTGDLVEIEVFMAFEDEYSFEIPNAIKIKTENMTLVEFIQYLSQIKKESSSTLNGC